MHYTSTLYPNKHAMDWCKKGMMRYSYIAVLPCSARRAVRAFMRPSFSRFHLLPGVRDDFTRIVELQNLLPQYRQQIVLFGVAKGDPVLLQIELRPVPEAPAIPVEEMRELVSHALPIDRILVKLTCGYGKCSAYVVAEAFLCLSLHQIVEPFLKLTLSITRPVLRFDVFQVRRGCTWLALCQRLRALRSSRGACGAAGWEIACLTSTFVCSNGQTFAFVIGATPLVAWPFITHGCCYFDSDARKSLSNRSRVRYRRPSTWWTNH